jgi:hypothetical protein
LYFRPTRPHHRIPVPLKPGLTNFSGRTPQANPLASKEKFSAGIFCFFLMPKRKSPLAAASRGKTAPKGKRNQLNVTHIDFYKINYSSG